MLPPAGPVHLLPQARVVGQPATKAGSGDGACLGKQAVQLLADLRETGPPLRRAQPGGPLRIGAARDDAGAEHRQLAAGEEVDATVPLSQPFGGVGRRREVVEHRAGVGLDQAWLQPHVQARIQGPQRRCRAASRSSRLRRLWLVLTIAGAVFALTPSAQAASAWKPINPDGNWHCGTSREYLDVPGVSIHVEGTSYIYTADGEPARFEECDSSVSNLTRRGCFSPTIHVACSENVVHADGDMSVNGRA
jgi:hypothetical protein